MEIVLVDCQPKEFHEIFKKGAPDGCKAFDYLSVAKRVKVDPEKNPDLLDVFVLKRIKRACGEKGVDTIYYRASKADNEVATSLRKHVKSFCRVDPQVRVATPDQVREELDME